MAISRPSHTKSAIFETPPSAKDYAHAFKKDQQKIEAMQNTVCILEIQINTKAIQNCNEIEINFLQFKK